MEQNGETGWTSRGPSPHEENMVCARDKAGCVDKRAGKAPPACVAYRHDKGNNSHTGKRMKRGKGARKVHELMYTKARERSVEKGREKRPSVRTTQEEQGNCARTSKRRNQ